jgi:hypothetical protein
MSKSKVPSESMIESRKDNVNFTASKIGIERAMSHALE